MRNTPEPTSAEQSPPVQTTRNETSGEQTARDRTARDRKTRAHRLAILGYVLLLIGVLFGITALIGVIVSHTNLPKTTDTHAHSHLIWQIISFWILFAAVAVILLIGSYSMLVVYACLLWWIASAFTGIWYLRKRMPIPFIKSALSNSALSQTGPD